MINFLYKKNIKKKIFFLVILIYLKPCLTEGNYKHPNSSYPHVSERTFAHFADFRVEPGYNSLDFQLIKNGDTVYVYGRTPFLETFFKEIHPQIDAHYILISHGSVFSSPGPLQEYLDDPKIIAWFAKNIDLPDHPKLFPLPLGMGSKKYRYGNTQAMQDVIQQAKPLMQRRTDKLLYINFKVNMNPKERHNAVKELAKKPFSFHAQQKNFSRYLQEMAQFRFVLSPPGIGMDCHRTWEALLLGCIPIIKDLPINSLYEDLPVIIVNDWSEITEEFLQKKYAEIISKTYNREKLFADYWFDQIRAVQEQFREFVEYR